MCTRSWWVWPVRGHQPVPGQAVRRAVSATSTRVTALGSPSTSRAASTPRSFRMRLRTVRGRASAGSYGATASYSLCTRRSRNSALVRAAFLGAHGEQHQPGGEPVQPVRGAQCGDAQLPAQPGQRGLGDMAAARGGGQEVRLVGDDDVLVAVHDLHRERHRHLGGQLAVEPHEHPRPYGASGGTGRPSAADDQPRRRTSPSTTPGPAPVSRSTRCSRTVAHAPSTGSRTRTASIPSRCGRGEGGGGVRRLITSSLRAASQNRWAAGPGRVGRMPGMPYLTSPVAPRRNPLRHPAARPPHRRRAAPAPLAGRGRARRPRGLPGPGRSTSGTPGPADSEDEAARLDRGLAAGLGGGADAQWAVVEADTGDLRRTGRPAGDPARATAWPRSPTGPPRGPRPGRRPACHGHPGRAGRSTTSASTAWSSCTPSPTRPSCRVATKAGFALEGTKRRALAAPGRLARHAPARAGARATEPTGRLAPGVTLGPGVGLKRAAPGVLRACFAPRKRRSHGL